MANGICKIDGCTNQIQSRDLCTKHLTRVRRYGDPHFVKHIRGDDIARFWSRVSPPDENGCRHWTGAKNFKGGYGAFRCKDRHWVAHRYYYEVILGKKVPEGMELGHYCEEEGADINNKSCICHVRPMTRSENLMMDRAGERNKKGNIPDNLAKDIITFYKRNKGKVLQREIVEMVRKEGFHINQQAIASWVTGKIRPHLHSPKSANPWLRNKGI